MRQYGGLIWTNHVLARLKERGITQDQALSVWRHPASTRYAKINGARIYTRKISGKDIELVTKKNDQKEWVVISAWVKKKYYKKKSGNFIVSLIKQLLGIN